VQARGGSVSAPAQVKPSMPEFVSDEIDPVNNLPQTTQKQRTASDAAGLPRANDSISSEQLKTSQAGTDRANDPISSEQQLSTSHVSTPDRANDPISSEQQLSTSQASTPDRANDPISSEGQLSTSQASTEPAVDYHKATQATSSDLPVTQPETAIVTGSRGKTREAEVCFFMIFPQTLSMRVIDGWVPGSDSASFP